LLDLGDPLTATVTGRLEALGFFFAGIIPRPDGGDRLELQYLNNVLIDYDRIQLYSDDFLDLAVAHLEGFRQFQGTSYVFPPRRIVRIPSGHRQDPASPVGHIGRHDRHRQQDGIQLRAGGLTEEEGVPDHNTAEGLAVDDRRQGKDLAA